MQLSESKQHYLLAIFIETKTQTAARVSDLAQSLNVSKASVSRAISSLEELGLVERNSRRQATLTPAGVTHAVLLADRNVVISQFLTQILNITLETAEEDACALEHLLSYETLISMASHLRRDASEALGECDAKSCTWPSAGIVNTHPQINDFE